MTQNNEHRQRRFLFWPFLLVVQAGFILVQEQGVLKAFKNGYPMINFIQKLDPVVGTFPRLVVLESNAAAARVIMHEITHDSVDEGPTEPLDDQCIPKSWQTTSHPNCNDMHSLSMGVLLSEATRRSELPSRGLFEFFGNGGNRFAGKLAIDDEIVVYKTGRYHLEYTDETMEFNRMESVAMEMLKGTTPDIYGYCGMLSVTEHCDGGTLHDRIEGEGPLKPLKKLEYAADISRLVANIHSVDNGYVTLIHRDLDTSNIVFVNDKPKVIDFHAALFVQWNATANKPCLPYVKASIKRPDTLPPEMMRDDIQDEMIDVYGLGATLFYTLTKARLYHCERPSGICNFDAYDNTITEQELRALKFNGTLPQLPKDLEQSRDPAIKAVRDAMNKALQTDPEKRPEAKDLADELERTYHELKEMYRSSLLLVSRQSLNVDETISAPGSRVYLQLHPEGKLCLYQGTPGNAHKLWCSPHMGESGTYFARLQRDGNLVIREGSLSSPGRLIWNSGSAGASDDGYFLAFNNAGRLFLYQGSPESPGFVVWSTEIESMLDPLGKQDPTALRRKRV